MNPTAETVRIIDELTTLSALGKLDDATKQTMKTLAETEAEGIDFLNAYLTDLKRNEQGKASFTEEARFNAWKGHIPAETRHGARLIVADDREHNKLVTTGYTRIEDYRGAGVEPGKRGYYLSRVAGNNTYHQGVLQTVNTSYFGVDPRTGHSVNGVSAGRVPGNQVRVIQNRLKSRHDKGGENLIPIYNGDGEVVSYERSMAPEILAQLDRNTHLGEMIGAWAGRQVEEDLAQDYNRLLINRLHEVWGRDRKQGREAEFVNLADSALEDPVHREIWSMIPAEIRSYIRQKVEDSGFTVRKDIATTPSATGRSPSGIPRPGSCTSIGGWGEEREPRQVSGAVHKKSLNPVVHEFVVRRLTDQGPWLSYSGHRFVVRMNSLIVAFPSRLCSPRPRQQHGGFHAIQDFRSSDSAGDRQRCLGNGNPVPDRAHTGGAR